MVRARNTKEEEVVGRSLESYISSQGIAFSKIERAINDKPDLLFKAGGNDIGCECVQIPPHRIYKQFKSQFKHLSKSETAVVRVVWPQEQHFWVKQAIESKNNKIGAYKKNCGAEKIWLLIHAPIEEGINAIKYQKEEIMNLIKYGANSTDHSFDEIYFWDPEKNITKIYPLEDAWKSVQFNFDEGYPTSDFYMGKASFKTTSKGEDPVLYDRGLITPNLIIIPPQDPEFRKHKPCFKSKKYHIKMKATSSGGDLSIEPVPEHES